MGFNLNISRKADYKLDESLIHEMINTFGIPCLYLYSEKVNVDSVVFNDFSHNKVTPGSSVQVTLKPEDTVDWTGDNIYNSFGIYNQQSTNLFISKRDILRLYPDFLEETGSRSKIVNSLLITPSSTILEITHVESFVEGVSNLWGFSDDTNSYKLVCKIYSNNLSDEGVTSIQDSVDLEEGPDGSREDGKIFEHEEVIDTAEIDNFFNSLDTIKEQVDIEADKISKSGGPFGSLG